MKHEFVKALEPILLQDEKSVFITGDVGYNMLEGLRDKLGKRFINAGVAEQNMMGMAAGMASLGYSVWVYSIAPFVTLRCLEQIRNDVCFHNLPVHIVGNGGGYSYGIMGSSHHALDDLGIMKCMPNMTLYFPVMNWQLPGIVNKIHSNKTPSYLRLATTPYYTDELFPHASHYEGDLSLSFGMRATVLGIGHATHIALKALKDHPKRMNDIEIIGLFKFPFPSRIRITNHKVIVLDEHVITGSLADDVVRLFKERNADISVLCMKFPEKQGSHEWHLRGSIELLLEKLERE